MMSCKEQPRTDTQSAYVPAKRKLGKKGPAPSDIFTYKGQIPLSFRTKQPKIDPDSSDSEDDDEAFERVRSEVGKGNDSLKRKDSGSDDDISFIRDWSGEEQDISTDDIKEVSFNRSLSPPPAPEISTATLNMMIQERQTRNKGLREFDNVLDSLKRSANDSLSSPMMDSPRLPTVIDVDDTSDFLPSPTERNVVVKVRTGSGIKRFTMKAADAFRTIISQLAKDEGVMEDKIMLSLGPINILGYDTPTSIHLSVADIIECVVMDAPFLGTEIEEQDSNRIELKVQGNESDTKKTFKVLKSEPLQQLMKQYCQFRKLPLSRLKFLFDGEALRGSETAEDLDMEDGDVIDVQLQDRKPKKKS